MKLFKLLPTIAATAVAASLSVVANSAQIEGEINFEGGATWDYTIDGSATIGTTTVGTGYVNSVEFTSFNVSGDPLLTTGDFDGLESLAVTTESNPWSLNTPVNIWTVGGFTMTLDTVTANNVIEFGTNNVNATVQGTGYIFGNGFDSTFGTFSITSQGNLATVSFSATSEAIPTPEPSAAALLALGAAGLALGRRRSARK